MAFSFEQFISRFWSKLPVRYRGAIVVALPAACAFMTVIAWGWSRQSTLTIHQRMNRTQAVIDASDSLLVDLLNAETGVRGYIITRDRQFLVPYQQAMVNLPVALDRLDQLLPPDSQHAASWQTLKQHIQQRISLLEQVQRTIATQPQTAPLSSNALTLIYQSKRQMDQVRLAIGSFQAEEQTLLANDQRQDTQIENASDRLLLVVIGVSLLSSVAALYLFGHLDRELQKREQRLQEAKSLLHAIVSNVVDGVIVLDQRGRIELFNSTAAQMFGYAPDQVIGRDLGMLIAPADRQNPAAVDPPAAFLKSHAIQLGRSWQTQGIHKEKTQFPIEISISDVPVEQRLIAIIRDVSEYQQTQEKLETRAGELARLGAILAKTNATLEERNRELEQFAYVASHDLKAPLRAIANLSEWIEEDLADRLPPENQHQMSLLRGRVHRMEALINGLLEYSRVGRTQATTETVDVKALLADVVDSLAPPASFTITIAPDLPTLTTKRLLLRQVFANLISNAIKHHDQPAGQITITARDQGNAYEFAVADDGPGIPAEYHDKIFVIFQTLQARDTKESTGVGLSIVKKIVETEGGTVRVESGPGRGTRFYFTWLK